MLGIVWAISSPAFAGSGTTLNLATCLSTKVRALLGDQDVEIQRAYRLLNRHLRDGKFTPIDHLADAVTLARYLGIHLEAHFDARKLPKDSLHYLNRAIRAVSLIPKPHLETVIRSRSKTFLGTNDLDPDGIWRGLNSSEGNINRIATHHPMHQEEGGGFEDAILHEVGHAYERARNVVEWREPVFLSETPEFKSIFQSTQWWSNHASSEPTEAFAFSFAIYFGGEARRAWLAKYYPKVHSYFERTFEIPDPAGRTDQLRKSLSVLRTPDAYLQDLKRLIEHLDRHHYASEDSLQNSVVGTLKSFFGAAPSGDQVASLVELTRRLPEVRGRLLDQASRSQYSPQQVLRIFLASVDERNGFLGDLNVREQELFFQTFFAGKPGPEALKALLQKTRLPLDSPEYRALYARVRGYSQDPRMLGVFPKPRSSGVYYDAPFALDPFIRLGPFDSRGTSSGDIRQRIDLAIQDSPNHQLIRFNLDGIQAGEGKGVAELSMILSKPTYTERTRFFFSGRELKADEVRRLYQDMLKPKR